MRHWTFTMRREPAAGQQSEIDARIRMLRGAIDEARDINRSDAGFVSEAVHVFANGMQMALDIIEGRRDV